MLSKLILSSFATLVLLLAPDFVRADEPGMARKADVIYARKDGMALTMDIFTPKEPNGAGVVLAVSGGYRSGAQMISPTYIRPMTDRGYTIFAVVHGSQPRYQVPAIIQDMQRAVRFIRFHAKEYGIDPNRLGATGASSGGNLSLMLGTPADKGNPKAGDPINREPGQVNAVACFFPPTDFLNFGGAGREMLHATDHNPPFRAAFDYEELDPNTRVWEKVIDADKLRGLTRSISPIYFISKDSAPTLIIHGDADKLVPIQQSQTYAAKLKEAGVPCELITKPGAAHGWQGMDVDFRQFVDWFDRHLAKKSAGSGGGTK